MASAPAVAGGAVYVRSVNGMLYAFDAAGGTGCSAAPTTCAPLWTARTAAPLISPSTSAPAVADGVVFVGGDHLYAFDAAGEKGCSGTPKTCTPLWTGDTESVWTAPVVAGGVVYVTANDAELHAFDAKGVKGCSGRPVTCTSLWTASTGVDSLSSPAVADGVVYVGGAHFYAFDATGNTKCSGHPKTCGPLWMIGSESYSSPAVADGVVYFTGAATLYAYVLEKIRRCQGGGLVCSPPLWTAKTDSGRIFDSSAAVANGVVYIGGDDDKLYAFDAAGERVEALVAGTGVHDAVRDCRRGLDRPTGRPSPHGTTGPRLALTARRCSRTRELLAHAKGLQPVVGDPTGRRAVITGSRERRGLRRLPRPLRVRPPDPVTSAQGTSRLSAAAQLH